MSEPVSRRSVLRGGLGLAGLGVAGGLGVTSLAGCGDKKKPALSLGIVSPSVPSGSPQRVVFVVSDAENEFITPTDVVVRTGTPDKPTGPPLPAVVHADAGGAPAYLTVTATLPVGTTFIHLTSKQGTASGPVLAEAAPRGVQAGMAMPAVATPTAGNLLGIETLCTRPEGTCSLHTKTVTELLAAHKPFAVLVATPAYCQISVCGPILSVLLDTMPTLEPSIDAVHLEVYSQKPDGTDISRTPLAPGVAALGITSEPVLYLVDSRGIVAQRLDGIVGTAELKDAVSKLS